MWKRSGQRDENKAFFIAFQLDDIVKVDGVVSTETNVRESAFLWSKVMDGWRMMMRWRDPYFDKSFDPRLVLIHSAGNWKARHSNAIWNSSTTPNDKSDHDMISSRFMATTSNRATNVKIEISGTLIQCPMDTELNFFLKLGLSRMVWNNWISYRVFKLLFKNNFLASKASANQSAPGLLLPNQAHSDWPRLNLTWGHPRPYVTWDGTGQPMSTNRRLCVTTVHTYDTIRDVSLLRAEVIRHVTHSLWHE